MKDSTNEIINDSYEVEILEVEKLTKDMKSKLKTIGSLSRNEIKSLVNLYYDMQDVRKKFTERIRSSEISNTGKNREATELFFKWVLKNMAVIEKDICNTLEMVCQNDEVGNWLLQIKGIGPVLAAGLLSFFDVTDKEYASQFISYSGLNDNNREWLGVEKSRKIIDEVIGDSKEITNDHVIKIAARTQWQYSYLLDKAYNQDKNKWSKTELVKACAKIPYNRELKTLLWKVGKSFQWQCNKPDSLYGRLYAEKKAAEIAKNEEMVFADQAISRANKVGKDTVAYKSYKDGKLPPAHIAARALRWTEKIFVSHLFEQMYRVKYDKVPPRYYPLDKFEMHNKNIEPEIPYHIVSSESK